MAWGWAISTMGIRNTDISILLHLKSSFIILLFLYTTQIIFLKIFLFLFALLKFRSQQIFLGREVIGKGIYTPLHPTNYACGYKVVLSFKFSR